VKHRSSNNLCVVRITSVVDIILYMPMYSHKPLEKNNERVDGDSLSLNGNWRPMMPRMRTNFNILIPKDVDTFPLLRSSHPVATEAGCLLWLRIPSKQQLPQTPLASHARSHPHPFPCPSALHTADAALTCGTLCWLASDWLRFPHS